MRFLPLPALQSVFCELFALLRLGIKAGFQHAAYEVLRAELKLGLRGNLITQKLPV